MKKQTLVALIIVFVVIAGLIAAFVGRGGNPLVSSPTTPPMTAAPTEDPNSTTVDIAYDFTLQFPKEYADALVHEQEVHGARTTEVFSMRNGEKDISLFRIDFGDESAGDWFGMLNIDGKNIPVTHTVFALANEELEALDEQTQKQYIEMMNSFTNVLNTISADPRFTAEKPLAIGADTEVKTTYWTLTLPSNMSVSESNTDGTYEALFLGEVVGERTALYQVRIGENKAETELGLYEIDGVKKPISVGSFELTEKINWTEDDYSAAYRMMDTINHVIEIIMNSPQFSVPEMEDTSAQ